MDIIDDAKATYTGFAQLNPKSILVVSFVGLFATLFFSIVFRQRLQESYGNRIFLWYIFLIGLNFANIVFMSGYFESKKNNIYGEKGPKGQKGSQGKQGKKTTCGKCSANREIGIQYSNKYNKVAGINSTTNILGEITIWRPIGMLGLGPIGDTISPQKTASQQRSYLAGFGSEEPTDFTKIITITDGISKITIWDAVPINGYSSLGHFASWGTRKPNPTLFACLPTECLIPGNHLNYIASFPAIDIIPSNPPRKPFNFCSFWKTPLNNFYCKVSEGNYKTNSLYYNIVNGSPEYYDVKADMAIPDKQDEVISLLQEKQSVIYHGSQRSKKALDTSFIQNIRNTDGKITSIEINGNTFNRICDRKNIFEDYLDFFNKAQMYTYKLMSDKLYSFNFIDDPKTQGVTAFNAFKKRLNEIFNRNEDIAQLKNFVSYFKQNPAVTVKLFQDPNKTFGIPNINYTEFDLIQKKTTFEILFNNLTLNEIKVVNGKLANLGLSTDPNDDDYINTINKQKKIVINDSEEKVDPGMTLWDDLFYLFPGGLEHQIAGDEDDALEGGIYLDDVEYRQHKLFVDYIRTFIKPQFTTYSFRKSCMKFVESDAKRNQIISDLAKIYQMVSNKLSNASSLSGCSNQGYLTNYYNDMMKRIDGQFKNIDNYNEKIANQEFSYFTTGRLEWLLKEMNKYYVKIKENCKDEERTRVTSQIKKLNDQLYFDFRTTIDFTKIQDIDDYFDKDSKQQINTRVNNMDFDKITIEQLKKILDIIKNKLSEKIEQARKAREQNTQTAERNATANMTYSQFIAS
jgi:hypothetical protein